MEAWDKDDGGAAASRTDRKQRGGERLSKKKTKQLSYERI